MELAPEEQLWRVNAEHPSLTIGELRNRRAVLKMHMRSWEVCRPCARDCSRAVALTRVVSAARHRHSVILSATTAGVPAPRTSVRIRILHG